MFFTNGIIVLISAAILIFGLFYAFRISKILQNYKLARPWKILTTLIFFFFFGYIFIALRFFGYEIFDFLSLENIMTAIFFFGALFVMTLSVLNYNLMISIFGVWIKDSETIKLFASHIGMPFEKAKKLIKPVYSVICDNCEENVSYSIPNIVRAHPHLNRGIVIDKGMGIVSYRLYVRHYCGKDLREIPVSHDSKLEYRSQSPSRPV